MNVASIIDYLRTQQRADGSFVGYASPHIAPFTTRREQPTLFTTTLILDCLRSVYGTQDIQQAAAEYLKQQVSPQGSWNYWGASSEARTLEPYPDDLDDTACTLAALTRYDAPWVNSQRLGQFARLLVSAEQAVGGPYNTWLIDTTKAPQWWHCDLAVNANVGYALSLQSVLPAGLRDYIDQAIASDSYSSDYYVGELPALYFLSRWYDGTNLKQLRTKLQGLIKESLPESPLHQALLLAAACKLKLERSLLQPLAVQLQAAVKNDHWPAAALYVDPVYHDQQHYGGSAALTTAFALEALTAYAQPTMPSTSTTKSRHSNTAVLSQLRHDAAQIPSPQLRRNYIDMARRLTQSSDGAQISAAASLVAKAEGWSISPATLHQLNLGSLNGWIAYTLYDNLIDGSSKTSQLNVANVAMRRSYDYFLRAADHENGFTQYVRETFDTIDSANDWELRQARAIVQRGRLIIRGLPDYSDYTQLAERSLGHSLAACGVFNAYYGNMKHPSLPSLQTFFRHFLIARQLNDDAHDWEADLRAGRLSAVVTLLLASQAPGNLVLAEQMEELRQRFWRQTIDEVAELVNRHVAAARQALADLAADLSSPVFDDWLKQLEASVKNALDSRNEALQFMAAYEKDYA